MEAGGARRRRLSVREEELLGLLASFPDSEECGSDRELSFSDLVEAGARPGADADANAAPALREDRVGEPAAAASKQQRQQAARQRARRSRSGGSRGSCGGGSDGVLLNFYVPPGLLTRSMTAPRPGHGPLSPRAVQGAPPKAATAAAAATAVKASRTQAPLGIGCWPALWGGRGRGRERRRPPPPVKACI